MDYSTSPDAASSAAVTAVAMGFNVIAIVLAVLTIIGLWKIFKKAGQPGWAAIVPLYNAYILLKIVGRPGWWLVLLLLPLVSLVVMIIVSIDLAKVFGRSSTFGVVGLCLFSFIGYMMLGFGKDQYIGVEGALAAEGEPAAPAAA